MDSKDQSIVDLLSLVSKNGVGFRTLFFRMNIPLDEIFNEEGEVSSDFLIREQEVMILFSDGLTRLGLFFCLGERLRVITRYPCKPDDDQPVLLLSDFHKILPPISLCTDVYIQLMFNTVPGVKKGTAGTVLINAF